MTKLDHKAHQADLSFYKNYAICQSYLVNCLPALKGLPDIGGWCGEFGDELRKQVLLM